MRRVSLVGPLVLIAIGVVFLLKNIRPDLPLFDSVAAVSVGVVDGRVLLDLDYEEDLAAAVDMNTVVTGSAKLIEVQATAEGDPFERATFDELVDLGLAGCAALSVEQMRVAVEATRDLG